MSNVLNLKQTFPNLDEICAIDINLPLLKDGTMRRRKQLMKSPKSSIYPNVCWMKVSQNWRAKKQHSTPDGITHHMKAQFFDTEQGAARCVDRWIRNLKLRYKEDPNLVPIFREVENSEESEEEMSEDEKLKEGLQRLQEAGRRRRGVKRARFTDSSPTPKRRRCEYPGCQKILRPGARLLPCMNMMVCNADYQYHRKHGYLRPISERQKGRSRPARRARSVKIEKLEKEEDPEYVPPGLLSSRPRIPEARIKPEGNFNQRITRNAKAIRDAKASLREARREERELRLLLEEKCKDREQAEKKVSDLQDLLNMPELISSAFETLVNERLLTPAEVETLLLKNSKPDGAIQFGIPETITILANAKTTLDLKMKIFLLLEHGRISKELALKLFQEKRT